MCRLLGYLGSSIQLDRILIEPKHSLIVQSYQPQEMTAGLLNADGFGLGWHDAQESSLPYIYRNVLPIWNDVNLPSLARYIQSKSILGYVRSATSNLSVDIINCQPFSYQNLLFIHNGYIDDFRKTLYRPIRNNLGDFAYQNIEGTTDSEHIYALIVNELEKDHRTTLHQALSNTITKLAKLAQADGIKLSANIILSNGREMTACRYSNREVSPTLYYLKDNPAYQDSVIIVSEPMFEDNWLSCPEQSIIGVGENLEVSVNSIT